MTAHKFWRFLIKDNNGGDTVNTASIALSIAPHSTILISNSSFSGAMPATHEILFEFTTAQNIGAYSIQAQGATAPKSWQLEFSDNHIDWTIAHIEYAQTRWQTNETRWFEIALFELNLTVSGSDAAQSFNLFVHDLSGNLLLKKSVQNGNATLLMPDAKPVSVTVLQDFGTTWQAGKYYSAGALISPTNPQATPFYYRNRTGAISDLIEPVWSTNPEIFTHDSGCIWELVERLNQPITQSPLIPTRKIS